MLHHKTSFNKFKKIEIIPQFFSNHKGIKLEINNKGKSENLQICENLKIDLNNQKVKKKSKGN